jgi:uncharacterized membrane protein
VVGRRAAYCCSGGQSRIRDVEWDGMAGRTGGWLTVAALGVAGAGAAVIAGRRGKDQLPVRDGAEYRTVRVVTVDQPISAIQDLARNAEQLSVVVNQPVVVHQSDGQRWRVVADSADGSGWIAEVSQAPDGSIDWSVTGGPMAHDGHAAFIEAPGDRGTEIRVELTYPQGRIRHQFATLTGQDPDQALRTTLRRAKSQLECGQVVSTMHEPSARGPVAERVTRGIREKLAIGGRP